MNSLLEPLSGLQWLFCHPMVTSEHRLLGTLFPYVECCAFRASPISSDSFFPPCPVYLYGILPGPPQFPLSLASSTRPPFPISLQFHPLLPCGCFPAVSARLQSPSPTGHITQAYSLSAPGWSQALQHMFITSCDGTLVFLSLTFWVSPVILHFHSSTSNDPYSFTTK